MGASTIGAQVNRWFAICPKPVAVRAVAFKEASLESTQCHKPFR